MIGTKIIFTVLEQDSDNWTDAYKDKPLRERWQDYLESLFEGEEIHSLKVLDVVEDPNVETPLEDEDAEYEVIDPEETQGG